jgi:hypothetical protein
MRLIWIDDNDKPIVLNTILMDDFGYRAALDDRTEQGDGFFVYYKVSDQTLHHVLRARSDE